MKTFGEFHKLLGLMPYATKEDLVYRHSMQQTKSLRELFEKYPIGYNNMLREMRNIVESMVTKETRLLRSAILKRLTKYGIDTTDWNEVNRFLEQPRIAGKRLYDMSTPEMHAFIAKMESILQKDKEMRQIIQEIAINN